MAHQLALKNLDISVKESAPKGKKNLPQVITLPGTAITEFNRTKKKMALFKESLDTLEKEIKRAGVAEIIDLNCSTYHGSLSSVKFSDDQESMALISLSRTYQAVNPDILADAFAHINTAREADARARKRQFRPVDANKFVQFVAVMKLSEELLYDKKGNFRTDIYREVRKSLDTLATKLVAEGKLESGSSLYTEGKEIRVKESFHADRWKAFTKRENIQLSSAIPNTVTLKPVVD